MHVELAPPPASRHVQWVSSKSFNMRQCLRDNDVEDCLFYRGFRNWPLVLGLAYDHEAPLETKVWLGSQMQKELRGGATYAALFLDYLWHKNDELAQVLLDDRDPAPSVVRDAWFYHCGLSLMSGVVPQTPLAAGATRTVRRRTAADAGGL